jgi:hypothetical protein
VQCGFFNLGRRTIQDRLLGKLTTPHVRPQNQRQKRLKIMASQRWNGQITRKLELSPWSLTLTRFQIALLTKYN